nr:unnamed protein product [Digitaria exilis]
MVRLVVAAFFLLAAVAAMAAAAGEPEAEVMSSYIVHVAATHAPRSPSSSSRPLALTAAYASFLHDHLPTELHDPTPAVHYSYRHAARGFAARLTGPQAAHLEAQPAILAVVPDEMLQLHTTMTPSFLRLSPSSGLIPAADGATDVVIGVIDSAFILSTENLSPLTRNCHRRQHLPRRLRVHAVVQRHGVLQQQARRRQVLPQR